MLRWRLIGSFATIVPLIGLLWLETHHNAGLPGVWLVPLGLLLAAAATSEIVMLHTGKKWTTAVTATVIAAVVAAAIAFVPVFYHPQDCPMGSWGWTVLGVFLGIALLALFEMRRLEESADDLSLTLMGFAVTYIIIPFSFVIQLRLLHPDAIGVAAVVSLMVIVKSSDAGAYFVGRTLGKHALAPRLSPKKTVEGAMGGILTAAVVAVVLHVFVLPTVFGTTPAVASVDYIVRLILYGLALAVAGIPGDLTISYFKRINHEKDSADWLPGLGGSLDLADSMLWAAPVGYLIWAAGFISL